VAGDGVDLELAAVVPHDLLGQREAEAADRAWTELRRESPLLSRGLSVDESLRPINGALWAEPRLHLGDLVVQPGLRLEGWSLPGAVAAQPRLTLRYELAEDLRLRGAVGQYAQAPTPENLSAATGDPALPLTRSQSAALGLDAAVAGRLEFGLDGYARRIQDGLDADPWQAPAVADGTAYGLELTSRYRLRERFFAYLSGVVARSTRGDHPGTYDQPYAISAVASWDINDRWNLGARYRYEVSVVWEDHHAMLRTLEARGYQRLGRSYWRGLPGATPPEGPCEVWLCDLHG
jgi:outer membrane receptor protein involved in Fe transport